MREAEILRKLFAAVTVLRFTIGAASATFAHSRHDHHHRHPRPVR
jgi:hypothetical protein